MIVAIINLYIVVLYIVATFWFLMVDVIYVWIHH
jgi:hypothetical protein